MRIIFTICLIAISMLYAENPRAYSQLGDKVYTESKNVVLLADSRLMINQKSQMDNYLKNIDDVRQAGLLVDEGKGNPKNYLSDLRKLEKMYMAFKRQANSVLNKAIATDDYEGFSQLVKTGMIDMDRNRERIIAFYRTHRDEENVIEEVESYIQYVEELNQQNEAALSKRKAIAKSYRQRRIEQINKRQAEKKAEYAALLEVERERTKQEVYQEQKKQLNLIP